MSDIGGNGQGGDGDERDTGVPPRVVGDRGVVAVCADPEAALVAARAVADAGIAERLAVHVPKPGVEAASVVRAVGDQDALLTALGEALTAAGADGDMTLARTASRWFRRHRRIWEPGTATPGVGTVYWCRRRPELSPAEYHHAWTTSHGPLALEHHMGMWDYDQVSITGVVSASGAVGAAFGDVDGVAVVQWPADEDLADRFFDGPEGAEAIRADASSFTDLAHTDRHLMTEIVLVEPDPATATHARWITDHRSHEFDRPVTDVWSVVGAWGDICDWWPSGLVSCETALEPGGTALEPGRTALEPGRRVRRLTTADGRVITEALRHHRPDEAMFELEIVAGRPAGIEHYRCRYEVRPTDTGCRLDWQPSAIVSPGADATFAAVVDAGWRQVRDGLVAAVAEVE